jgi:hypothetical protein
MPSTFAESIAARYLNEEVELFMGNSIGSQQYSDFHTSENCVIDCKIIGAEGETLIVEVTQTTPAGASKTAEVLLHGWAIEAVIRKSAGIPLVSIINMPERKKRK